MNLRRDAFHGGLLGHNIPMAQNNRRTAPPGALNEGGQLCSSASASANELCSCSFPAQNEGIAPLFNGSDFGQTPFFRCAADWNWVLLRFRTGTFEEWEELGYQNCLKRPKRAMIKNCQACNS